MSDLKLFFQIVWEACKETPRGYFKPVVAFWRALKEDIHPKGGGQAA